MRTAIVTGAYGAIGKAIARGIALNNDFRVLMIGRDELRLFDAAHMVSSETPNNNVVPIVIDLSSLESIHAFTNAFHDEVSILVNNAATTPRQRLVSTEGVELQWSVNVLGYFRMIQALIPNLMKAENARVINVASYWAGGLNLDDPEFNSRPYHNDVAYRQSKQADRMLTRAFAERLRHINITVNACHPGDVNSKLSNDLGFGGHQSPQEGAETPLWLALSQEAKGFTGKYFEQRKQVKCDFMSDPVATKKLYSLLTTY